MLVFGILEVVLACSFQKLLDVGLQLLSKFLVTSRSAVLVCGQGFVAKRWNQRWGHATEHQHERGRTGGSVVCAVHHKLHHR